MGPKSPHQGSGLDVRVMSTTRSVVEGVASGTDAVTVGVGAGAGVVVVVGVVVGVVMSRTGSASAGCAAGGEVVVDPQAVASSTAAANGAMRAMRTEERFEWLVMSGLTIQTVRPYRFSHNSGDRLVVLDAS